MKKTITLLGAFLLPLAVAYTQTSVIKIDVKNPVHRIDPKMYGIFYEDINFAADGGLNSQMIKNGSFEFDQPLTGWSGGSATEYYIRTEDPCFENNPTYARIIWGRQIGSPKYYNEGFRGMGIKKGEQYHFSMWVRCLTPGEQKIKIDFVDAKNKALSKPAQLTVSGDKWHKVEAVLRADTTFQKARLRIDLLTRATYDIDAVSLYPTQTWQNQPEGLRKDIAQALADLKPGVLRFPGGCIVEGLTLDTRYDWKKSVMLPKENRPLNQNLWNARNTPLFDYYQSYGLGFFEFFCFAEQIGAEPLPVLGVGVSCQARNAVDITPLDQLDPFVQDALDLIEFANGDTTTVWGRHRAAMGHPEPFGLKMIGIGNESFGEVYTDRFAVFQKAIKAQYPDMIVVGDSGLFPEGEDFEMLWKKMTELKAGMVDEHFYRNVEWFFNNADRYDNYNRKGPKVYIGEYACRQGNTFNTFESALAEAAFMTGIERNADVVKMASYAPLMAHVEAAQWTPDLIWFNNTEVLKTPNYYVQQLYSHNKGTHTLKTTLGRENLTGQENLYASSVVDENTGEIIVKIVNASSEPKPVKLQFDGMKAGKRTLEKILLTADRKAENSFENPNRILPQTATLEMEGNTLSIDLEPDSFNVFKIRK